MIKGEEGYTIAELLIALTIVSIVLGVTGSVFVFVSRQMNSWSGNIKAYNNYQVLSEKIYRDLIRAEKFSVDDTSFSVSRLKDTSQIYEWGMGNLKLNGKEMNVYQVDSSIIQWSDKLIEQRLINWELYQVAETRKLSLSFKLNPRKPVLWEPLKSRKP